jgi:hypothetical protein
MTKWAYLILSQTRESSQDRFHLSMWRNASIKTRFKDKSWAHFWLSIFNGMSSTSRVKFLRMSRSWWGNNCGLLSITLGTGFDIVNVARRDWTLGIFVVGSIVDVRGSSAHTWRMMHDDPLFSCGINPIKNWVHTQTQAQGSKFQGAKQIIGTDSESIGNIM